MGSELIQFRQFQNFRGMGHFISSRFGGVSKDGYESFNLSLKSGDDENSVHENRKILADQLGFSEEQLYFPDQCHTNRIQVIESKLEIPDLTETDGMVTHQKGICLCVLSADCVPILLYDSVKQVVGAVHAGWKGTAAGIVRRAIDEMIEHYGCKPGRIMAGIGPAISAEIYEVGEEVENVFEDFYEETDRIISHHPETGRAHIDLQEANRILLLNAGLKESRIEVLKECTFSNPDRYFSARRDGFETGRFAAGIFLRE